MDLSVLARADTVIATSARKTAERFFPGVEGPLARPQGRGELREQPPTGPLAQATAGGSWGGSRWLFPGRRAGQPMHPNTLSALVNSLGVPTTAGRAAAIREHVLEMPAPVVADALGYHQVTTAKLAAQAGGTWSRYAARGHLRSPSGWTARGTDEG